MPPAGQCFNYALKYHSFCCVIGTIIYGGDIHSSQMMYFNNTNIRLIAIKCVINIIFPHRICAKFETDHLVPLSAEVFIHQGQRKVNIHRLTSHEATLSAKNYIHKELTYCSSFSIYSE